LLTLSRALLTLSLYFGSSPGSNSPFAFGAARAAFSFFKLAGAVAFAAGAATVFY